MSHRGGMADAPDSNSGPAMGAGSSPAGGTPLSSSGLGRWPFKPVARVRIPLGVRIWFDQWKYLRSLKDKVHIREMTWEQWKKSAPNADFRPMTSIMKDSTE